MVARSAHENLELAHPVFARHLDRIAEQGVATRERQQRLARRARAGNGAALDELVDAHLHGVVAIARDFDGNGLRLMDLIAEGTVGLVRAARTYDENRDGYFAPYALRSAREEIRTAAEDSK